MPASGSGHSILRPHPQLIHSGEDFTDIPKARPHHSHQGSDSSWVVVPQPGVPYLHFRLHVLLTASLCLEGSSCLVTSSSLDFISDGFFLPRSDHHIAVTTPQYTAVLCTSFPFPSLAVMRNCESNLKWGGYWVLFFFQLRGIVWWFSLVTLRSVIRLPWQKSMVKENCSPHGI